MADKVAVCVHVWEFTDVEFERVLTESRLECGVFGLVGMFSVCVRNNIKVVFAVSLN